MFNSSSYKIISSINLIIQKSEKDNYFKLLFLFFFLVNLFQTFFMKQICVFFLGYLRGWKVQIRSQLNRVSQQIKAVHCISAPLSPLSLSLSIQNQKNIFQILFLAQNFRNSDWATQNCKERAPLPSNLFLFVFSREISLS